MISSSDAFRNVIIAGTASVPILGGPVSVILDKYLPSHIERRYHEFVEQLSNRLEIMKMNMSEPIWTSKEFITLFHKTLEYVICELREEKIEAYQNILINVATKKLDFDSAEFYSKLISLLTMDQLIYLYAIDNTSVEFRALLTEYPYIDQYYLLSIVTELTRYRLIKGNTLTRLGSDFLGCIVGE